MQHQKFFSRGKRNGKGCLRACTRGGIVLIALLVFAAPAAAQNENPAHPRQGGDTIATATVIPALPYSDTGTTTGYQNDYDESCGYEINPSPDVVYSYTPAADVEVDISLCGTSFGGAMVYVYRDNWTPGSTIACNYTYCMDSKPFLWDVSMDVGHTYYIVIDGRWTSGHGDYVLNVFPREECGGCPPDATVHEGEPICNWGYFDFTNGGCSLGSGVFGTINPGDVLCGRSGVFLDDWGYYARDWDWFELTLTDALNEVTFNCTAEFPLWIRFYHVGPGGCSDLTTLASVTAEPCDTGTIAMTVPSGEYYFRISPDQDNYHIECGVAWVADVTVIPDGQISAELTCVPQSGTVAFVTSFSVTLTNEEPVRPATMIAAQINVLLANGSAYSNWKAGSTVVAQGGNYTTGWNQTIPALGSVIGENVFTLVAEDVTPAPYNQPPYSPSGDIDTDNCTVTGIAP